MSRAFVKELDGEEFAEDLPDRPVSLHRNLVTRRGLALIEAEIERLRASLAAATAEGVRSAILRASRELRYWTARRASAEPVMVKRQDGAVSFGSSVAILRDDGRRQTFTVVGEDEADPTNGLISYVSPLARALLAKRAGDVVQAGRGTAEIIDVS